MTQAVLFFLFFFFYLVTAKAQEEHKEIKEGKKEEKKKRHSVEEKKRMRQMKKRQKIKSQTLHAALHRLWFMLKRKRIGTIRFLYHTNGHHSISNLAATLWRDLS